MKHKLMSVLGMCLGLIGFVSADFGGECFGGMMSGSYAWGASPLTWIIKILVIVALGLVIAWLWKQIQKTDKKKKRKR